mmetsp:Transcript_83945/g.237506  ORF Transcript_83945/g.237506 Transcript_83945/m.237506 type:complete len:299 (+) Transcript_83945:363-1259(+)
MTSWTATVATSSSTSSTATTCAHRPIATTPTCSGPSSTPATKTTTGTTTTSSMNRAPRPSASSRMKNTSATAGATTTPAVATTPRLAGTTMATAALALAYLRPPSRAAIMATSASIRPSRLAVTKTRLTPCTWSMRTATVSARAGVTLHVPGSHHVATSRHLPLAANAPGWNGAAYTIAEIQSRVQQATGTLTTGAEGTDSVCLLPGCYLMVVSAGSWATEASWSLDDIASGGAPTECKFSIDGSFCNNLSGENAQIPSCGDETDDAPVNVDDDCTDNLYQLVLIDAYGDGAPPLGRS